MPSTLWGEEKTLSPSRPHRASPCPSGEGGCMSPAGSPQKLPRRRPSHRCVLPEAKLQTVLDGARVFPRRGWDDLWFWRRRGLLFGEGDSEGELGGLGLPKAGQKVRRDMLGAGAGAAAPLGFAPLVERHVPLPSRARAAVHGRGVGVVAVLLETLPKMAVRREPGLQGHRRGATLAKGWVCLSPAPPHSLDFNVSPKPGAKGRVATQGAWGTYSEATRHPAIWKNPNTDTFNSRFPPNFGLSWTREAGSAPSASSPLAPAEPFPPALPTDRRETRLCIPAEDPGAEPPLRLPSHPHTPRLGTESSLNNPQRQFACRFSLLH